MMGTVKTSGALFEQNRSGLCLYPTNLCKNLVIGGEKTPQNVMLEDTYRIYESSIGVFSPFITSRRVIK